MYKLDKNDFIGQGCGCLASFRHAWHVTARRARQGTKDRQDDVSARQERQGAKHAKND
jgi:hypothetical protein